MTTSKSLGPRSIIRSLVAWSIIAGGLVFIYLSVGQLLALFVTPSGMSSSPSQPARDFVGQYGQGIGLLLISTGQWIRGRKPRLKLRRLPRLGKAALLIALIAATQTSIGPNLQSIVPVFAWGGTTHRVTLTEAAVDMAVSYDYMGVYQYKEMFFHVTPLGQPKLGFGEDVAEGAVREDDLPNDNYHFYSPADGKGLQWKWYFPIRALLEPGPSVPEPPGDVFTNAYVRARSGWGYDLGDKLNWYGALKAYDYTPDSKQVAYTRLGHVAHLLEDMAEPDHANLVPHPGSSKSRTEIYSMVASLVGLIMGLVAGSIELGLLGYLLGQAITYFIVLVDGERYGFEKLIREQSVSMGKFLLPPKPEYRASLKAYFNLMAIESVTESASSGLLAPKDRTALGVDNLWIGEINFWTPLGSITLFKGFPTEIPLLPAINPIDPNDVTPHSNLANLLGTNALARTAGLLMWYYDIVNFPPYVKQVSITQGGEVKYKAEWEDTLQLDPDIGANRVISRNPKTSTNKTLESSKPAEISVTFGPIGGTNENPVPKKIWRPEVKVGGVKVDGNLVADNVWKGEYTPQLGGCKEELKDIEIIAYDRDRHHIHGSEDDDGYRSDGQYGETLDSDPASPAKLRGQEGALWPTPPYEWIGYTPGWDKDNYKVAVKPTSGFASVTPEAASLVALDGQSYHFTITMANGPADVKLKAQGVPPGAQAEFYPSASVHIPPPPHTANVILKITVSSATPVGTYKIQIGEEGDTPLSPFVPSPCYPWITLNVKPFAPYQPTADFTIAADPSNSTVEAGSSTTTKIRVSSVTLPIYGSTVSLSLSPPPAGFTVTLSPPPAAGQPYFEKMMEVKVAPTVEAGKTYQITVTGTGGDGKTHSAIFAVFVKRPFTTADFSIKVNPASGTVQAGFYTTAEVLVTTGLPDWYPYTVTLYSSAPSGWLVFFSLPPPSGQPIFTKSMQVTVPKTAQPGSYTVTITGVGADFKTHQAIFTVLVTAPVTTADFVISANPSSTTIQAGGTNTVYVSVTTSPNNPYTLTVSLSYSAPSGWGVTFSSPPPSGQCPFTKSMTINVPSTAQPGNYQIIIIGIGTDDKTHFAPFTVTVPAPVYKFNVDVFASPLLQSVSQGQSATYVVTITLVSGSTQAVSLDLRGLPSGATFYFRPNVGNPTFTSTLLITTTTRTPLGDHVLTIVASGGGVVKSTTVRLQVVPPPIRAGSKDGVALAPADCQSARCCPHRFRKNTKKL